MRACRYNAGMISATSFSEVWMTAMTLQGDADGSLDCGACGVRAGGTGLYAEGVQFTTQCFSLSLNCRGLSET